MAYPKKGECRNTGRTRFKKGMVSSNKGKKLPALSEEHKKKISDGNKGKHHYWLGKKMTEEHRRKMSESQRIAQNKLETKKKKREVMLGEKNHQWKGGVSSIEKQIRMSEEYNQWRKAVYERDYWTCQICGKKCQKHNIVAHHHFSFADYPQLRFAINNGITLCRNCHYRLHQKIKNRITNNDSLQPQIHLTYRFNLTLRFVYMVKN